MTATARPLPDAEALAAGLNAVFGASGGPARIVERTPAIWASTYPSEVVTCQLDDADELKLYCKYMAGLRDKSFGHRRGLPYEVDVYRRVLRSLAVPVVRFYGAYEVPTSGDLWLFLEYLDQGVRVTKGPQPESVVAAARWLGRFHAANQSRISLPDLGFLNTYDAQYYLGWSRRTLGFASEVRPAFPWLETLCCGFEACVDTLLAASSTVIHGEFYPHNILLTEGRIYPIDWESAAIAAGEIDLATLTEAWKPAHRRQCELAYQEARWQGAPPPEFERTLATARLYLCFRWMGERPAWTLNAANREYFDQMRAAGEQLGLI